MSKRLNRIAQIVKEKTGIAISPDLLEVIFRAEEQQRYEEVIHMSGLEEKMRQIKEKLRK